MDPITIQMFSGAFLFALVLFQVAVGLRWIKLGKKQFKIHKWVGIALPVTFIPHTINALRIAGVLKF